MGVFLFIFVCYVIPMLSMFIHIRMSYSSGGKNEGKSFDMSLFWVMVTPGLNILGGMVIWSDYPKHHNPFKIELSNFVSEKIFGIKSKVEEEEINNEESTLKPLTNGRVTLIPKQNDKSD